jgi:hypothetical protein
LCPCVCACAFSIVTRVWRVFFDSPDVVVSHALMSHLTSRRGVNILTDPWHVLDRPYGMCNLAELGMLCVQMAACVLIRTSLLVEAEQRAAQVSHKRSPFATIIMV